MDEMTFFEVVGLGLVWLGKIYVSNGFTNTILLAVFFMLGAMSTNLVNIWNRTGNTHRVGEDILRVLIDDKPVSRR